MKQGYKVAGILLTLFFSVFPQTFLSGELKGTYAKDSYIITGTISVKAGDTLRFQAGSELRFQPNTGLDIRGVFIAAGTVDSAIALTAANEQEVASRAGRDWASYRWKGIVVTDITATLKLSYCLICFSESAMAIPVIMREIVFNHVVFHRNGPDNFKRGDIVIPTEDNIEYVYQSSTVNLTASAAIQPDQTTPGKTANVHGKITGWSAKWIMPVRISFAAATLLGGGLWIGGYSKANKYEKQYQKELNTNSIETWRNKRDNMAEIANFGIGLCFTGIGIVAVTFVF